MSARIPNGEGFPLVFNNLPTIIRPTNAKDIVRHPAGTSFDFSNYLPFHPANLFHLKLIEPTRYKITNLSFSGFNKYCITMPWRLHIHRVFLFHLGEFRLCCDLYAIEVSGRQGAGHPG